VREIFGIRRAVNQHAGKKYDSLYSEVVAKAFGIFDRQMHPTIEVQESIDVFVDE
jgi:hypothetical protein